MLLRHVKALHQYLKAGRSGIFGPAGTIGDANMLEDIGADSNDSSYLRTKRFHRRGMSQ